MAPRDETTKKNEERGKGKEKGRMASSNFFGGGEKEKVSEQKKQREKRDMQWGWSSQHKRLLCKARELP